MNIDVASKLEKLRVDYNQVKGHPFSYFYCPILFTDEETPLCQAHIVNKAFRDSPRAWTIQRQDVDNFFGSNFEADFTALQCKIENWSPYDIIRDKTLSNKLKPRILVDNKDIDSFVAQGNTPKNYTRIEIENTQRVLKMSPEDVITNKEQNWEIEINKDVRISALVSLIKAAHLTLFEMLGYRYALSVGGYFVGRQILGEFFVQNRKQAPRAVIIENAHSFFRKFVHMVRPIQVCKIDFQGTITDNQLLVCKESSGTIWARIVFIRTSQQLHAVMIPDFNQPNAVVKFNDFLNNNTTTIQVNLCRVEPQQDRWAIMENRGNSFQLTWPKSGALYP